MENIFVPLLGKNGQMVDTNIDRKQRNLWDSAKAETRGKGV